MPSSINNYSGQFRRNVSDKYIIYNSLFAALPYSGIANVGEALWREAGDLAKLQRGIFAHSIADQKIVISHDADDIARPRFIDCLTILGKKALGIAEANGFACANMGSQHIAAEAT